MKYPREINTLDRKWAHPEVLLEDSYLILHDFGYAVENQTKSIEYQESLRDPFRKPLLDSFLEDCCQREKDEAEWAQCYTDKGCPLEPEARVRMLVRRPRDLKAGEKLPAIIWYHGGGLMCGTPETAIALVSRLMLDADIRAIAFFPEYRLAPGWKYPAAINDCHAAFLWVVEHAEELQIDPDNILISGGSSGGHMVLSTAFRLKDYGYHGHMPRGVVSCIPVMDDTAFTDSAKLSYENDEGEIHCWDLHGFMTGFRLWLGDLYAHPAAPPEAVPNRARPEDVVGFPPTWFPCCAELDGGRDSVYAFAQMLHHAGIFCDFHVWGGCSHLLMGFDAPKQALSKRVQKVIAESMRDAITYDFRRPWLQGKN